MVNTKAREGSVVPAESRTSELRGEIFGPPPLVAGENAAAYEQLEQRISAAVQPKDFIEEIWVRDVVDQTWDVLRLRRLRASYLTKEMIKKLEWILCRWYKIDASKILATRYVAGDAAVVAQVDERLKANGVSIDTVIAGALTDKISYHESFEQLISSAEARRNATLREVDRHRASIAAALRRASDEIVDAEFEHVPSPKLGRDIA